MATRQKKEKIKIPLHVFLMDYMTRIYIGTNKRIITLPRGVTVISDMVNNQKKDVKNSTTVLFQLEAAILENI